MAFQIDLHGVSVSNVETDYGDYVIDFYPRDHKRTEVEKQIPDMYEIVHRETAEGGELVSLYVEKK